MKHNAQRKTKMKSHSLNVRCLHVCGMALALTTLLVTPAYAGMLDMLNNLSKKIAQGDNAADVAADAEYTEELRKEMPAYK